MRNIMLMSVLLLGGSQLQASEIAWSKDLGDEITWSRLSFAGTLIAASESQLAHFDTSGELLWLRDDLAKLAQFNVKDVTGTPFLIISERLGNVPPKSRLQILNLTTGETLWDTGSFAGGGLGAYPIPEKNLLVYLVDMAGAKPGVYAVGYSLDTGEERWRNKLGSVGSLPTHPSDTGGFIPSPDLNGHPPPVVTDDMIILPVGKLIALRLDDGSEIWRSKHKASVPQLKNTYAQPILDGETLYAVSKNSIHALDATTGAEKWKVKVGNAMIPEMQLIDGKLVGRLGGTFSNGKKLVQQKPFGAFVVDTNSKTLQWKWTKAKKSVTNFKILHEQGLVVLADKNKLYALDLNAQKKGKVVLVEELEFKRKMGSADVAAKGIGVAGGLLGGGLAGGFKSLGGGSDRSDPPLDIDIIGDRAIVRAQYHVLSFDLGDRSTAWSIEFAPPGMSSFALIAMGAVTAVIAVESAGATRAAGGWQGRQMLDSTLNISESFEKAVATRYAAAEKARNVAFFLTREEDEIVLLGIDLGDGAEVGRIPMAEKEPQFMVDAIGSRVYYFRNKTEMVAYDF